ncbi:MAG: DJ-1/PfpI family protein [Gemmatimonadaceae bacterium]|nr:DJ-1/PfpI family protein [Gemmatimonadaceae bacterium]
MNRLMTGIVVFDDVEVLDFCGPFEVFSVTRLSEENRRESLSPFDVRIVAESLEPVRATGGLRVLPDESFASCPPLDLLVVPGGWGTRPIYRDDGPVIDFIRSRAGEVATLTSVCTGAMLLGRAGLLEGRRATTHWCALDWMADELRATTVVRDEHVVAEGALLTSAGISAGIEMSLQVVERCFGAEVAVNTARQMEYRWPTDNVRRV